MDPNEALRKLREGLRLWHNEGRPEDIDGTEAAMQVIDAASALDAWLSSGGVLPSAWSSLAAGNGS